MRAVIDTNIIVSALLQPLGPPAQVLMLALTSELRMFITADIYAEYEEVISRPRFQLPQETIAAVLESIRSRAYWVRPGESVNACSDPDDNMFLECAQAADADYLVTGNLRHFPATWGRTRIVTAASLLALISPA